MDVRLEPVTHGTLRAVANLSVAPGQEGQVAPNALSVAESKFFADWEPCAVYAGDDLVGFVMYGNDVPDHPNDWWIIRMMIDGRYQRRGYGRRAMELALKALRAKPGVAAIKLSVVPGNEGARALYKSLGFASTGVIEDGEEVFALDLARSR